MTMNLIEELEQKKDTFAMEDVNSSSGSDSAPSEDNLSDSQLQNYFPTTK